MTFKEEVFTSLMVSMKKKENKTFRRGSLRMPWWYWLDVNEFEEMERRKRCVACVKAVAEDVKEILEKYSTKVKL